MPRGTNLVDSARIQGRLWTPQTSTLAVKSWYDCSDISTLTVSTRITEWRDKSGNGWHLANATNGPSLTQNGKNGLAVAYFDNKTLSTASAFTLTGNPSFSFFIVYQKTDSIQGCAFGWGDYNLTGTSCGIDDTSSAGNVRIAYANSRDFNVTSLAVNSWNILSYTKSPGAINTTSTAFRNGADAAATGHSSDTPAIASNPLVVGQIANYTGNRLFGYIGEFLILSETASPGDRQRVEGYLSHKWAIPLSALHPFVNRPPFIGD